MLINLGEVADGVLINAIAAAGRWLGAAGFQVRGRGRVDDLTTARWFDTYEITRRGPALPDLSPALTEQLAGELRSDETQAVLQELLAVRLTEGAEADVTRVRAIWYLTFAEPGTAPLAEILFDHYDDKICELVARLEGRDPALLRQIRDEAFNMRIIAVMNAIERHTAVLSAQPDRRGDSGFVDRYRRHVVDQHGKIEPPDFDRRRRVPIADIYIPTVIYQAYSPERDFHAAELDIWQLAEQIDRTVLLGDPGGGKTTAANVLAHYFASDEKRQIPFIVTLRDFAAQNPPERSVVGYIEHRLENFYQCPAPAGLIDRLLLTGRALLIFDGLDELLDTSRRADVSTRVERFCSEYPHTRVLVTSRLVGYNQARLDHRQFSRYHLRQFGDEQVGEFVVKWFAQEEGTTVDSADRSAASFLAESLSVPDLRTNPLLLSLMCILYRGEGSLPRNRAEVYEQCANLLFRRWDARRGIHNEFRAYRFLDSTLQHLAWWLFTRGRAQSDVTEDELVGETASFLHGRGFEAADEARDAAREFVEFCRGRTWVFSDMGTTASGEHLYSFTHRTFLEYFAAAQIAFESDTPERLARSLAKPVSRRDWEVVAELAIQIKNRTSKDGARRIYIALIGACRRALPSQASGNVLEFLAKCLRSVDPSPSVVRDLTQATLDFFFVGDDLPRNDSTDVSTEVVWSQPFSQLLACDIRYRDLVADEVDVAIAAMTQSSWTKTMKALWLALSLTDFLPSSQGTEHGNWIYWHTRSARIMQVFVPPLIKAGEINTVARDLAIRVQLFTIAQALGISGDPQARSQKNGGDIIFGATSPQLADACRSLREGWPAFGDAAIITELDAIGHYLIGQSEPPWLESVTEHGYGGTKDKGHMVRTGAPIALSNVGYLGAAAILSILTEQGHVKSWCKGEPRRLGPLRDFYPYLARRWNYGKDGELPELPISDEFEKIFTDWAEKKINFTILKVADLFAEGESGSDWEIDDLMDS